MIDPRAASGSRPGASPASTTSIQSPAAAGEVAQAFVLASRAYLTGEYLPKIRRCLVELRDDEDVWWRPNSNSNSVGNLILHLCGNARHWVLHGICRQPDTRDRPGEFSADGGWTRTELRAHLDRTLEDVDAGLRALEAQATGHPGVLLEERVIQGNRVTVLQALYHVVEHFSQHTGQILWITKARIDRDLGFWTVKDGKARRNW